MITTTRATNPATSLTGAAGLMTPDNATTSYLLQFLPQPSIATVSLIPLWSGTPTVTSTSSSSIPRWFNYVRRRLEELGSADRGGDFGPRSPDVIRRAWMFAWASLNPTTATPSVAPGEGGGIDFIWRRRGWHVELSIDDDGESLFAANESTGESLEGSFSQHQRWFTYLLRDLSI